MWGNVKRKQLLVNLGPVHTYTDIFESATFSLRIRLLTANPEQKKKNALQSGKKYIRNESVNVWTGESGYFFIRWRKKRVQLFTEQ